MPFAALVLLAVPGRTQNPQPGAMPALSMVQPGQWLLQNARRFEVDLEPFPTLVACDANARALDAFAAAAPERVKPSEEG